MRIQYDAEADILFLVLGDGPPVDSVEEPGGVIISYGEDGEPVSISTYRNGVNVYAFSCRNRYLWHFGNAEFLFEETLYHTLHVSQG